MRVVPLTNQRPEITKNSASKSRHRILFLRRSIIDLWNAKSSVFSINDLDGHCCWLKVGVAEGAICAELCTLLLPLPLRILSSNLLVWYSGRPLLAATQSGPVAIPCKGKGKEERTRAAGAFYI